MVLCLYAREALRLDPSLVQPVLPPLEPRVINIAEAPAAADSLLANEWAQWWNSLVHGSPVDFDPFGPSVSLADLELSAWPTLTAAMSELFEEASTWAIARRGEIEAIRARPGGPLKDLERAIVREHFHHVASDDPRRRYVTFVELPIRGHHPHETTSRQFYLEAVNDDPTPPPALVFFVGRELMSNPVLFRSWLEARFPVPEFG